MCLCYIIMFYDVCFLGLITSTLCCGILACVLGFFFRFEFKSLRDIVLSPFLFITFSFSRNFFKASKLLKKKRKKKLNSQCFYNLCSLCDKLEHKNYWKTLVYVNLQLTEDEHVVFKFIVVC